MRSRRQTPFILLHSLPLGTLSPGTTEKVAENYDHSETVKPVPAACYLAAAVEEEKARQNFETMQTTTLDYRKPEPKFYEYYRKKRKSSRKR